MKSRTLLVTISIFSIITFFSCKKDEGSNTLVNIRDSVFVSLASQANFAEIAAGQIAADSATDSTVADFGAMMVADHTAAQQQLQSIASQLGISIPTSVSGDQQRFIDSLFTLKGRTFDSVYIHRQVLDHQRTITFFKEESAHGLQKDIKAWMYQTLPAITVHQRDAAVIAQRF